MRTIAILPVKSFTAAKQRLAGLLGAGSRQALAQAMFSDVLSSLRHVQGLDAVAVVTADRVAEAVALGERVQVLGDPDQQGQSQAAAIGIRYALAAGYERVLLVPGDTPLLDPAEVAALLAQEGTLAIVPDRHGSGTNALLIAPPDAIEPSFGPDSFERHVAAGRAAGAEPRGGKARHADARRGHPRGPRRAGRRTRGAAWQRSFDPRRAAPARPLARPRLGHPGGAGPGRLSTLTVTALPPLPGIGYGDDIAGLVAAAAPPDLAEGDVLVIAHKVVSKSEGRTRILAHIDPGRQARELAAEHGKDARLVQAVLDESAELLRAVDGVFISLTRHGFVCANAGIDQSNASVGGEIVLLPEDPDASARRLREGIGRARGVRPAVVVTDSFGRAWRIGQTDVAIGIAGLAALEEWRGRADAFGRELRVTTIAVADAAAGAADLARAKDSRQPAVLVRGLERYVSAGDGPGAAALRRPSAQDLFR